MRTLCFIGSGWCEYRHEHNTIINNAALQQKTQTSIKVRVVTHADIRAVTHADIRVVTHDDIRVVTHADPSALQLTSAAQEVYKYVLQAFVFSFFVFFFPSLFFCRHLFS